MRDIAATGTLRYAVDGYFWYCSFASAFLLKFLGPEHRDKVDAATREKIVEYVRELIGVLGAREVAVDASHPPKLFSKFLAGMLAKHVKQQQPVTTPSDSPLSAHPFQTSPTGSFPQTSPTHSFHAQTSPVQAMNTSPLTEHAPTPALTTSSPGEPAPAQAQEWQFAGFEQYDAMPAEQAELMKDVSPQELNTGMFILDHPPWWHDASMMGMDLSALAVGGDAADFAFDGGQQQQQFGAYDASF